MAGKIRNLDFARGRYSTRLAVPQELRAIVGKSELVKALGADRVAAIRKHPAILAGIQDQLTEANRRLGSLVTLWLSIIPALGEASRPSTTARISVLRGGHPVARAIAVQVIQYPI